MQTPSHTRLIALGEPESNERAAIKALDAVLDPEWIIFHSRKPLQGRPDIDVLIVTPYVVFAAELKYYRDTISITSGPRWQRQLADGSIEQLPNMLQGQTQKQAQQIKAEWKATAGLHHAWIEPVVIFTHETSCLRFTPADGAALDQVVFGLADAKTKLEHLVARHRAKMRRPLSRADLEAIAASFGDVTLPAASKSWSLTATPPVSAKAIKTDDRLRRERRRRIKQWMAILTLLGALLVTFSIYMLVIVD